MFRGCIAVSLCFLAASAIASDRPNILWLSIEDASCHLGCYDDEHARTPNLDEFANESVLYENAFVCAPVCAPCRSSIITGVYPTSLGTHNMRSTVKLPPEIRPFTTYLRDAGYYCTNNSKQDYQFKTPKGTWDDSSGKAHWKNRKDDQPFFAVFNFTGTHESATRGDQPKYDRVISVLSKDELHDPAALELPPYYPNTPKVRQDWARYYNCMTAMDKWAAEKLKELDEAGLADDTIVFFWSDHGVGLPRGKRWLYDSGIQVPLIVRIPEKWQKKLGDKGPSMDAGTRTDELVSLIDLPETVLNLAGVAIPTYMQGRAFLGTNLTPEREYIYAARDRMDERYDMSRCVRTKRYKYIRNYMPWRPWTQWLNYAEQCGTMQELRRLKAEGKLSDEQLLWMADVKPVDELYDLDEDPHELVNLFASTERPENDETKSLQGHLLFCERAYRDLGILPESEFATLETKCGSRYGWFFQSPIFPINELSTRSYTISALGFSCAFPAYKMKDRVSFLERDISLPQPENRYWSAYGVGRPSAPPGEGGPHAPSAGLAHELLEEALLDRKDSVRIAAAEMLTLSHRQTEYIPFLLDALENAESPWDRLQAANVIDLLPDFDEHADEIRPVVQRVQKKLQDEMKTGPAAERQGLGYVERCVIRFNDRLKSD
ncbi:sulfatase family protein [Aeoliella sp.]|uniref:sulfatase family protein n=1 Tax=Aeoliella sp. TaxID=2795800 RepID=UPI003CCB7CC9